jgi:3-oxoacyl-[acyl-carrier-protein] synthase-3
MYTVGHSRIVSTGAYTPPNVVTSHELMNSIDCKSRFDVDPEWLERTTGIRTRRFCDADMLPSDMAVRAANEAMERAKCRADDIDAIIYAGMRRDRVEPSTAHDVQRKLGARRSIAMDISNACLGFMSALHVMDSLIATGQVRRGLIVTGEQGFHHATRNLEQLRKSNGRQAFHRLAVGLTLGDAGGAMLLGPKLVPDSGILQIGLSSAGEHSALCTIQDDNSPIYTDMPPLFEETAKLAFQLYVGMMKDRLNWSPTDISRYVPHQVGIKGIKLHARAAGVDITRIPEIVSSMGNIISATIPYALAQLEEKRCLKPLEKVYLSGTGSGISVAQAGVIWDVAA